jgi:formylglycine-generating enzyme required for sulfatase activity
MARVTVLLGAALICVACSREAAGVDRTEVTVREYRECVAAGKCKPPATQWKTCNWNGAGRDEHPANCVTWDQANTYCSWKGKRLPTETEWDAAAKGVNLKGPLCRQPGGTCAVGSTAGDRSSAGAMDMAANVREWTATEEKLPGGVLAYVLRGGGWSKSEEEPPGFDLLSTRDVLPARERAADVGFRCTAK